MFPNGDISVGKGEGENGGLAVSCLANSYLNSISNIQYSNIRNFLQEISGFQAELGSPSIPQSLGEDLVYLCSRGFVLSSRA